ncbi:MAG: hypothetical protein HQ469_14025 [Cyanobacteria bacterium]|nr:hypothetical protein [Cyanobacteria bacterium bin.275]
MKASIVRTSPLLVLLPVVLLPAATSLWLLWPLLRPAVAPAPGTSLVVVLDGYHRLDAALQHTGALPLLLITCPRTGQPTQQQRLLARGRAFWILSQGWDSAQQLTQLARWLQRPPAALPAIGRVLLVSDSHHLPRLLPAAEVALGNQGLRLAGLTASTALPAPQFWPIARDWLRLQLWRASGSTGAFLVPQQLRRKQADCG